MPVRLHAEVRATVKINIARSMDEAERQAKGEDVIGSQFDDERQAAEQSAQEVIEGGAGQQEPLSPLPGGHTSFSSRPPAAAANPEVTKSFCPFHGSHGILNLVCTQAKTSLHAVQRDENKIDAFIQCFGSRVFLQGLDEKTNKLAEATMGQMPA